MSAAVITAVNWEEDTNVVVRFDPFHRTTEPTTKPLPLTVSVNAGPPAPAVAGLKLVVVGTGLLIVKVRPLEVPPPGAGLNTVTEAVPAIAMSAAVIAAVNWVEDTNVVARFAPCHRTIEPATKLLPLMVSTKSVPPAIVEAGLRLVVAGTGLLIVRVPALEVPPPGADVNTVTDTVPAVAMSAAGIAALNLVEETYVVGRLAPFHCTTESLMKPLPLTVSVKAAPPAVRDVGLMLEITGTGGSLIVKVWALEVPPPGAGLNTVTEAVPAVAMSAAVIAAVSRVEETYVVVRPDPFHWTTELELKPLPLTVNVNPALPE
jgi:hypothetical protein